MSDEGGWREKLLSSPIGRIINGLLKISLASLIIAILSSLDATMTSTLSNIPIGSNTYDLSIVWILVSKFAPLMLVISAFRDFGVKL